MILGLAACSEGAGAHEFSRLLKEFPNAGTFLETISTSPVTIDHWQLEMLALVAETHRVWFYTPGLPQEYHKNLWGPIFASAPEALAREVGTDGDVAVIPEVPYVFARPSQPQPEMAGV